MKKLFFLFLFSSTVLMFSCGDDEDPCTEITWFEDADGDGLGNPNSTQIDCDQPTGYVADNTDLDDSDDGTDPEPQLHNAFAEFDDQFTIFLDGDEVIIETNGLPNHESPYWSEGHELDMDPVCTTEQRMSPGDIDRFNGSFTLTVPTNPVLANSSTATGLGAIGIAVSGSVIYNDEEGPNVPLDNAVGSLDCNGAHTGPQSYHYHLEPKAWSDDDNALIGIMSDGFFLYGRKCFSTGTYPTDLDESGGHSSTTQHTDDSEYHYHIQNDLFLGSYYILFPGDYQGTPNGIN